MNAGGIKGTIARRAYAAKKANYDASGTITHPLWDRLLFSKVSAVLGGRVRLMVSGSAPISPDVLEFLRLAFSCPVVEGYGSTESCAGTTITVADDRTAGHVGCPVPCQEIKLVDVPEMGYHATDKPYPARRDLRARPQHLQRLLPRQAPRRRRRWTRRAGSTPATLACGPPTACSPSSIARR